MISANTKAMTLSHDRSPRFIATPPATRAAIASPTSITAPARSRAIRSPICGPKSPERAGKTLTQSPAVKPSQSAYQPSRDDG